MEISANLVTPEIVVAAIGVVVFVFACIGFAILRHEFHSPKAAAERQAAETERKAYNSGYYFADQGASKEDWNYLCGEPGSLKREAFERGYNDSMLNNVHKV